MIELIQLRSWQEEGNQSHVVRTSAPDNRWPIIPDNSLPSHCQASIAHLCARVKEALGTTADILVQFEPEGDITVSFNQSSRIEQVEVSTLPSTAQAALANIRNTIGGMF